VIPTGEFLHRKSKNAKKSKIIKEYITENDIPIE
jgi:hypothetical protein